MEWYRNCREGTGRKGTGTVGKELYGEVQDLWGRNWMERYMIYREGTVWRGTGSVGKAGLGICSFAHSLIHSFCSNQMSKCERFAQIAQEK